MTAARRTLEPIVSALFTTPKMSLLPMLMLLLGVGDAARIVLIAAGSFVMLALHSMDAVRSVNRTYLDLAANYGAGRMMEGGGDANGGYRSRGLTWARRFRARGGEDFRLPRRAVPPESIRGRDDRHVGDDRAGDGVARVRHH